MPRVTVITPLYNSARFIKATVRSALAQSFADFEHVIVDDGSTDGSAELVAAFDDARIRLVRAEHGGSAAAYNACLALACGEFVAVLDHDDVMHPGRLAAQVGFLDVHPAIDIVGSDYRIIDEAGATLETRRMPVGASRVGMLQLTFNAVAHQTVMFRRAVLDGNAWYRAECEPAHDTEFLTRLGLTHGMDNIPEALTDWRRVATSPTAVRGREQMRVHNRVRRDILETRLRALRGNAGRAECLALLGKIEYYDGRGLRALGRFAASMRLRRPDAALLRYFAGALAFPLVRLARATGLAQRINRWMRDRNRVGRYFAQ